MSCFSCINYYTINDLPKSGLKSVVWMRKLRIFEEKTGKPLSKLFCQLVSLTMFVLQRFTIKSWCWFFLVGLSHRYIVHFHNDVVCENVEWKREQKWIFHFRFKTRIPFYSSLPFVGYLWVINYHESAFHFSFLKKSINIY